MNNDPHQPQGGLPDMGSDKDTQQEYQSQPALPPIVPQQITPAPLTPKNRLSLSRGKAILLIGLVLLVLVGAVRLFFVVRTNQLTTANASATATSIAQAKATAAVNPLSNPYPPNRGTLVPNACVGAKVMTQQGGIVAFQPCSVSNYSNFAYQIRMIIVSGVGILGGVGLGGNYDFLLDASGSYRFIAGKQTLKSGTSAAIKTGLNQPNTLAVVVQGSSFDLYVNRQLIAHVNDSSGSAMGFIALTDIASGMASEIDYDNGELWTF
jgi:hypothetical protein